MSNNVNKVFLLKLEKIQPSQLYISRKKLALILKEYPNPKQMNPVPIKRLNDDIIYTDGHTRAYAAYINGLKEIFVEWEDEDLDWEMYTVCVDWCKKENIFTIGDLQKNVISHEEYEILWYKRCKVMQEELIASRSTQK